MYFSAITYCALAALVSSTSVAQSYPAKPIRIIAPFPPGGGIDASARITAQALAESFGQQVIVDKRAGAGGRIGAELAAKAPPDGYTRLMGSSGPNAVIPAVQPKLSYAVSDFTPVSLVAISDFLLVAHPSLPVNSVKDLIALARSNPAKLDFGSTGNLGGPHLAAELFKILAKVEMVHVAYKGGGPQITALISGEISLTFASLPAALGHVKASRLRALGVSGSKRNSALPTTHAPCASATCRPLSSIIANAGCSTPSAAPSGHSTRSRAGLRARSRCARQYRAALACGGRIIARCRSSLLSRTA